MAQKPRRRRATPVLPIVDLVEHWDRRCAYCGTDVATALFARGPAQPTVDHFVPKSAGGRNVANLVLACSRCNNLKGSIDPRRLLMIWMTVDRRGFYRAVRAVLRRERRGKKARSEEA